MGSDPMVRCDLQTRMSPRLASAKVWSNPEPNRLGKPPGLYGGAGKTNRARNLKKLAETARKAKADKGQQRPDESAEENDRKKQQQFAIAKRKVEAKRTAREARRKVPELHDEDKAAGRRQRRNLRDQDRQEAALQTTLDAADEAWRRRRARDAATAAANGQ